MFSCCVQLFVTPWTAAHQASLFFTISWSLLKFMSIESGMLSNHLILCSSFLLLQTSIFPSIRVFSDESIQQKCPEGPLHARPPVGCFHSYYLLKFFYFIEVQLNYNIVLVSAVQHSYSAIHTHTHTHTHTHISSFPLWFITGY